MDWKSKGNWEQWRKGWNVVEEVFDVCSVDVCSVDDDGCGVVIVCVSCFECYCMLCTLI